MDFTDVPMGEIRPGDMIPHPALSGRWVRVTAITPFDACGLVMYEVWGEEDEFVRDATDMVARRNGGK